MNNHTRREFVKTTATGIAASGMLLPKFAIAQSSKVGQVRHAVIGVGGQGRAHVRLFSQAENCEVVAICDVDPSQLDKAAKEHPAPSTMKRHDDFRRILDDTTIHSVSVTTPDHWHTPVAMAALLAGKHVYVEKPCSHVVHEGNRLVDLAAKTGLCVQHGTQHRSGSGPKDAVQALKEGIIGEVRMAKAINHQRRGPIGRAPISDPPPGANYDRWLGSAPKHAFTKNRWHYNWHWFWDYGCGDIGNDGIHQIDMARWGLDVGYPKRVTASGGQLAYDDDHETPDTQLVTYEYDNAYLVYEMRLWTGYPLEGHDNGVVFYGDKGTLEIGRNGCEVTLIGQEKRKIGGPQNIKANVQNFVDCIRNNAPTELNAPINEGQISASLCHFGNIATIIGRPLDYDVKSELFRSEIDGSNMLTKSYRKGYELPEV